MIDGETYIKSVKNYFSYLGTEFGFLLLEEKIRGNAFYSVEYSDRERIVSISYENIEDCFTVIIFLIQNGNRPNYDDKTQTLHLDMLNKKAFSVTKTDEIQLNSLYFSNFKATSEIEKSLLKTAKELRLCLKCFDKIMAI